MHIKRTGLFQVRCAGTAFRRDAIASIAVHPAGSEALTFCLATLIPEPDNPHDADAVAVHIEGRHVGYLPAAFASRYRRTLEREFVQVPAITAHAVISKGLATPDRRYDYCVEIDVAERELEIVDEAPAGRKPMHSSPSRPLPADAIWSRWRVWLDGYAAADVRQGDPLHSWSAPHWATLNVYAPNAHGTLPGHKLLALPKSEAPVSLTGFVEAVEERFAIIRLTPN